MNPHVRKLVCQSPLRWSYTSIGALVIIITQHTIFNIFNSWMTPPPLPPYAVNNVFCVYYVDVKIEFSWTRKQGNNAHKILPMSVNSLLSLSSLSLSLSLSPSLTHIHKCRKNNRDKERDMFIKLYLYKYF